MGAHNPIHRNAVMSRFVLLNMVAELWTALRYPVPDVAEEEGLSGITSSNLTVDGEEFSCTGQRPVAP